MQRLDQRHNQPRKYHRNRWEQCWTDRSSREFRVEYRGRAYRSPSRGRFSQISPNSAKHQSLYKVDAVFEQLCVQVGSSCSKCNARKFQAGHPKRKSDHPHKTAYKHLVKGAHKAFPIAEYEASLIARLNEAPDYIREPDVYHLWQRFYRRPSRPSQIGLASDADLAAGSQRNPFNFKYLGVNRIEMKLNGTSVPRGGYTPNFANGQYLKAYSTFLQELECDTGDNSISLTPLEWANGYTLYAFKITDGLIGSGTYNPRSKSTTKSARLKVLFAAPVNESIKVIVYYQLFGRRKFDQFKAVFVLWAVVAYFTL